MKLIKKKYQGKGSLVTVFVKGNGFTINLDNPLPGQIEMLPEEFTEVAKEK